MRTLSFSILCASVFMFTGGCGQQPSVPNPDASSPTPEETVSGAGNADGDTHAHPSEGPHHGALVELGNEEYHAEFVHNEQSVTIYILDASGTKAVPIDVTELMIHLMHEGTPLQYALAASADAGDPPGKSSRFTRTDAKLVQHLEHEAAAPKLLVTIDGTPYRGDILHDHDHSGHDH